MWIRGMNLAALAVLGVVVGYLIVVGWRRVENRPETGPVPAESSRAGPVTAGQNGAGSTEAPSTPSTGSSLTVVGGLTPDERDRLRQMNETGENGPPLPPPADAGVAPGTEPGEAPTSLRYPLPVREAASAYLCLCGCAHGLATCPCNDQPLGAGTMLTHLQKLLEQELEGASLDAAMVDRYGERVLGSAPGRSGTSTETDGSDPGP